MENMEDVCVRHNYTQRDILVPPPSFSCSFNFLMAICSFISPFVWCFPGFLLFLISTSRHNTTNFLSLTQQQQQQQQQHHFPLTHSAAAAAEAIYPRAVAIYPKAAAVATAVPAAVGIPPKTRYKQKQNQTHYENTTH